MGFFEKDEVSFGEVVACSRAQVQSTLRDFTERYPPRNLVGGKSLTVLEVSNSMRAFLHKVPSVVCQVLTSENDPCSALLSTVSRSYTIAQTLHIPPELISTADLSLNRRAGAAVAAIS